MSRLDSCIVQLSVVLLLCAVISASHASGADSFPEQATAAEFGTPHDIRINRAWPIRYGQPDPKLGRSEGWLLRGGGKLYAKHCASCHGATGAGDGVDAAELHPSPRDFRTGSIKFHDGGFRDKPSRHAFRETLRLGLPGTAMHGFDEFDDLRRDALIEYVYWLAIRGEFAQHLAKALERNPEAEADEREEMVLHAKEFLPAAWQDAGRQALELRPNAAPPQMTAASVERGRKLYNGKEHNCVACHDADGSGASYARFARKDAQGRPLPITDLTGGKFKGGDGPVDLFLRIRNGIPGTDHPGTFRGDDEEHVRAIWDIVHYVYHLSGTRPEAAKHIRRPPPANDGQHPQVELDSEPPQPKLLTASGWGTLRGRILYDGEPPARKALPLPNDANAVGLKQLLDPSLIVHPDNRGLANVVIWFEQRQAEGLMPIHKDRIAIPDEPVRLECRGLQFLPHVLALRAGQPLQCRNNDPVGVNVRISPRGRNAPFNQILSANQDAMYVFAREERLPVPVTDAVHPTSKCYLVVKSNPYYAVTDTTGAFEIVQLPAGTWQARLWHERSGYLRDAKVGGGVKVADEQFFITITPDEVTDAEVRLRGELFQQR